MDFFYSKWPMNYKGKLLVAETATYGDSFFSRTVILITEDTEEEVIGFILNLPKEFTLQDIFAEAKNNFRLFSGGPVEQDNLYFLHNIEELKSKSQMISDGVYWGADFNSLAEILETQKIERAHLRFFLGYSGWTKDQLVDELDKKYWTVIDNPFKSDLLKITPSEIWKELMKLLGDDHLIWANAPSDPIMN